ncbi:MAG: MBL fold metallo-hydrolase [Phycisphaerae bacterium]|nr:MBL fold metallo-hydrolase [Phycisphaerae bacterium]
MSKTHEHNVAIGCTVACLLLTASIAAAAQPVENTTRGTLYDDIGYAIAEAADGDVIEVAPGTYNETVDFAGKAITLRSQNPSDSGAVASTVIDGNECAVSFANDEGADSVLAGFTITGATCGICCNDTAPTILNCRILDNTEAGVRISQLCPAAVVNCIIAGNGGEGVGIVTTILDARTAYAIVDHCTIVGNRGSGVSGDFIVTNSIIRGNCPEGAFGQVFGTIATRVAYCNVEGGYDGIGNIDEDPEFVLPGAWARLADSTLAWVRGNYHLLSDSPCIDAGDPAFVADVIETDIDGHARISGNQTDIGCDEVPQIVYLTWYGRASVRIASGDTVIYVDPYNLNVEPRDGDLILVTHSHSDHYSPSDIAKVAKSKAEFVGAADVVKAYGRGQSLAPGQTVEVAGVRITGVAMYNLTKTNHPKSNNWVGFIVQIAGMRIYLAGDTDLTPEVKAVTDIDVAFLPVSSAYTMNAADAAEATKSIQPTLAVPYHWGTSADAEQFSLLAACNVKVMTTGEKINSETWSEDFTFLAHWKLDESEGLIASDSVGDHDGTLVGGPVWEPTGGLLNGAIQLDGLDDTITTLFVRNPAEGVFSVFAWVRGGVAGQTILSQSGGANWLVADASTGALATQLKAAGRGSRDLVCDVGIVDGEWHQVGLTWDGSSRTLYVDSVMAKTDTQGSQASQTTGLRIGSGANAEPGTFWAGLIDDVRVYSRVIQP